MSIPGVVFRGVQFIWMGSDAGTLGGIHTTPRRNACLAAGLVTAILLAGLAWAQPVVAQRNISDRLVEATGSTDMLGGGDYVFVRFGTDALFGVLWGNATNPNNVYLVALKARYLGVAQVYDTSGQRIAENLPVKYWTIYAIKLIDLVEFRDQDGDGVANYTRGYDGTNFTTFTEVEPIPKRVDLSTNWTPGTIARTASATSRSWEFNLTATNLSYVGVNEAVISRGDNRLNTVRFTFHLNASLVEREDVSIRSWRVTVDTSRPLRPSVTNVSREANLTFSGKVATYGLKWDQEIVGWDFEPGPPRRLLLEFGAIVGNLIPPAAANWLDESFVYRRNETGRARYETDAGNQTTDNRTGDVVASRPLRSTVVEFEGDWTRVGRFLWVSNSTIDGVVRPNSVYARVLAGHRIVARGEGGGAFVGFVLLGALSYPEAANSIVHDPEVTTDVLAELVPPGGLAGAFIAIAVAVVVALVGVALFVAMKRRRAGRLPKP